MLGDPCGEGGPDEVEAVVALVPGVGEASELAEAEAEQGVPAGPFGADEHDAGDAVAAFLGVVVEVVAVIGVDDGEADGGAVVAEVVDGPEDLDDDVAGHAEEGLELGDGELVVVLLDRAQEPQVQVQGPGLAGRRPVREGGGERAGAQGAAGLGERGVLVGGELVDLGLELLNEAQDLRHFNASVLFGVDRARIDADRR